jgi:hypothetical protein
MKLHFEDLKNWSFEINEISNGFYEITAKNKIGNIIQMQGTEYDKLIEECREAAKKLITYQ